MVEGEEEQQEQEEGKEAGERQGDNLQGTGG